MQGTVLKPKNGSVADWSTRMGTWERELERIQVELNRLGTQDEESCVRRTVLMDQLRERTMAMHSFLEDCLCGRNAFEQAMMLYKVRIEFPLYSQMDMVFSLTPAHVS